jgi:hypothetical protein
MEVMVAAAWRGRWMGGEWGRCREEKELRTEFYIA